MQRNIKLCKIPSCVLCIAEYWIPQEIRIKSETIFWGYFLADALQTDQLVCKHTIVAIVPSDRI